MIEALREGGSLTQAARIADRFKLDPVHVLNAPTFEWYVRVAAYQVIADDEEENAARMKAQNKK